MAKPAKLHWSKVVSIDSDDFGGFADVGRKLTVTLENGHVETGDSEHGGWNLLKLVP